MSRAVWCLAMILCALANALAQTNQTRTLSGVVLTQQFEVVPNVAVEVRTSAGKLSAASDAEGKFSLQVPHENLSVSFSGSGIAAQTRIFAASDSIENL